MTMFSITGFEAKVAELQWLIAMWDAWSMPIAKHMALIAAQ
jgi:hypothetical protein